MTKEEQLGWKVVTKTGLLSSLDPWIPSARKYSTRFWTYPDVGCGPLCVFETRAAARKYIKEPFVEKLTIYRCKYIPSDYYYVWYVEGITQYEEPILFKTPIGELPKKTRLASKVKLLYKG